MYFKVMWYPLAIINARIIDKNTLKILEFLTIQTLCLNMANGDCYWQ